jgi:8-amino-7-oxononanoate synthase
VTRRVQPPTPGNRGLDARLEAELAGERAAGLARRCPPIQARAGLRYRVGGREVLSFCSNDYLGFADRRSQVSGARGGAASRLVCGDLEVHRELEREFASFLGFEEAVLFPSGFQANVAVPAALLRPEDLALSDALNHASLIDGLRLSAAPRVILPHLERPPADATCEGLRWWLVESVFSMDGDGPALADLETHLADGGCLYLDEAHALGLYVGGRGRASSLRRRPTIVVAPLGKAFGCAGAFVCGSRAVCEWIRGHARAFVFTTAVSPILVAAIREALEQVAGPEGERRRELLWRNVDRLRAALGLRERTPAPILPIVVGDNSAALELSAALLDRGWHVQAIRPPTVPEGKARLRITVSAGHELAQIDAFARDLLELLP